MNIKTYENHWRIEDLPWASLTPAAVDADLLKVVKAAALVEYNASVYADYLKKIFHDDAAFCAAADRWAVEEVQHGAALGAWAEKIDPTWSLETAMARFRAGYSPEHFINGATNSVRGSRAGEMVARCMVETGTSSYYSAIGEATTEPVLQEICKHIAADEFKHYKLFYDTLNKYLESEKMSRVKRLSIALGRIAESEDDELSYAFYAANENETTPYDRVTYNKAYLSRAYGYYRPKHLDRAVAMIFKACGFKPHTLGYKIATHLAWKRIEGETKKMQKKIAA